jgi:hypothetical protein
VIVMDNFTLAFLTAGCTAFVVTMLYVAFFLVRVPKKDPEIKKLKRCPTCKRWQEVG